MLRLISLLFLLALPSKAATYYCATNGTAGGSGSISSPWDLLTAMTLAKTSPGDTVLMRSGAYIASSTFACYAQGTPAAHITFQSYPGEWATVLSTNSTTPNNIMRFDATSSNCVFMGFEVTCSDTNRINNRATGIRVDGTNEFIINCVIHETGSGIAPFDGTVTAYGNLIYYNGMFTSGDWTHGHGIYAHSFGTGSVFQNNISFENAGSGLQLFSSGGDVHPYLNNATILNNISFENGSVTSNRFYNMNLGSSSVPVNGLLMAGNCTYFGGTVFHENVLVGYVPPGAPSNPQLTNITATITNNYVVGGELGLGMFTNLNFTSNTGLLMTTVFNVHTNGTATSGTWDYNGYGSSLTYSINAGAASLNPAAFQSQFGFETHSGYSVPTNQAVFVFPNAYQPGSGNIVVYNYGGSNNVAVNLSSVMPIGANYTIKNAANYFGGPVLSGIYSGGLVSLPMMNLTAAIPVGLAAPPVTGPTFNVFTVSSTAIISADRMVPWIPQVTVGVQGGIPNRTNLIDVTQSPYNADSTGATDSSVAVQAAVNAATNTQVVYMPDGQYQWSNAVTWTKSGITLRGHTNTVIYAPPTAEFAIKVGPDLQNGTVYNVTNGSTKGSQTIVLSNAPSTFGVGDQIVVSDANSGADSPTFPRINIFHYENQLRQQCLVAGVSGQTVTLADPLMWNFTNNPIVTDCGIASTKLCGLENLIIRGTNDIAHYASAASFLVLMSMCENSWITNCNISYAGNYFVYITSSCHIEPSHNWLHIATSVGSNHAGYLLDNFGESLVEDNILSEGIQPAIEFGTGCSANAFFANCITNVPWDVDCHNTHPMMNLWEQNAIADSFVMDGYFGSASHQTLFRNNIAGADRPIICNRWTTYMNIVGNVLGRPTSAYTNFTHDINNVGYSIIELGRPELLLTAYTGTNPPISWNFPGFSISNGVPNGICTFTNNQLNTTNLIGNFTNIPIFVGNNGALLIQDAINTNFYYPTNGIPIVPNTGFGGTSSNLGIAHTTSVYTAQTAWWSWQNPNAYQQLQTLDRKSYVVAGNFDYYQNKVTWTNVDTGTNVAQAIPVSLLYTNGPPWYWGSNRWPAMDPLGGPITTLIPAQERYDGFTNPPPASGVYVSPLTNALGTHMRTGDGSSGNPFVGDFDFIIDCLSNVTVFLLPGTHYSQGHQSAPNDLEINAGTVLIGFGTNTTTVKKYNVLRPLAQNVLIHSMAGGVVVSNLMVDCDGSTVTSAGFSQSGVGLGADNCTATNIWVKHWGGNMVAFEEAYCIALGDGTAHNFAGTTNCVIANCTATDTVGDYQTGIWFGGNVTLVSNTVVQDGNPSELTACFNSIGSRNAVLVGNYGYGATMGLWTDTGTETNLTIIGNTFSHCYWGVRLGKSGGLGGDVDGLTIASNSVSLVSTNGPAYGIQLSALPGLPFHNLNIISNSLRYEGTGTNGIGVAVTLAWQCNTNLLNLVVSNNVLDHAFSPFIEAAAQGMIITNNVDTLANPVTAVTLLPWFCLQPQSQSVLSGSSVNLTSTSVGSPDYQWELNGNPIAGANNSNYSIASAGSGDAGTYTVTATLNGDTAFSVSAVLTVIPGNIGGVFSYGGRPILRNGP